MEIEFTDPDHLTADFVGEPGRRTFYIQASEGVRDVTILVEKQQVAGLAEVLTTLLEDLGDEGEPVWDIASMRLREPVEPRWRAGSLGVGLEPVEERFAIEAIEFVPEAEEREPEQVRVWASREQARRLAAHANWSVEQGRPPCKLCGLPMDAEGHVCPRTNGDARHA